MSNEYKILLNTAERLGIQNDSVIRKAKEFLRIFQSKGSVKALSESAKIVLCLDLAATCLGTSFDKETAIKLSGLKKSVYQNNLHTVEKILDLDKPQTVSELCVQFGCTIVKDLAEEVLQKYKASNSKIRDLRHPQYVVAAIYIACKIKSVKIQKTQLVAASHLKPSQWKELINDFDKFVELHKIGSPKKKKKDDRNNIVDKIMENIDDHAANKKDLKEEEIEPYEVWKKRILDEAYAALRNEKNMQT